MKQVLFHSRFGLFLDGMIIGLLVFWLTFWGLRLYGLQYLNLDIRMPELLGRVKDDIVALYAFYSLVSRNINHEPKEPKPEPVG